METVETQQLKGKNWLATLLFAWFLGGFGAHRFYTGKTGTAWAMAIMTLLGCTAPISMIWATIDTVMIALGNWKHEDGSDLYERVPWLGYVYIACLVLAILGLILYFGFIVAMVAAVLNGAGGGAGAGY